MKSEESQAAVNRGFVKINLKEARRHVLLCVGPDCCSSEQGLIVWEHLKQRLKTYELPVLRTKAACLRICSGGPWMVVYPEGVWYGGVTIERCTRIVAEHLLDGHVIAEWATEVHPLPFADSSTP